MNKYIIKDPWWSRTRDALNLVFICSWCRHDRPPAFGGGFKPCRRCSR